MHRYFAKPYLEELLPQDSSFKLKFGLEKQGSLFVNVTNLIYHIQHPQALEAYQMDSKIAEKK